MYDLLLTKDTSELVKKIGALIEVDINDTGISITAVHENKIYEFHEQLNKQNTSIQFTKEFEENGKIPFLDCLVTRENNTLRNNVYRKLTHTDSSYLTKRLTILLHTKRLRYEP